MVKIMGLTLGQYSGCAIFIDDKIAFSASEERYSRRKSDESYPINTINDALKFTNTKPSELDQVLIAGKNIALIPVLIRDYTNFSVKENLEVMEKYWYPKLVKDKPVRMTELFKHKIDLDQYPMNSPFAKNLDFEKIEYPDTPENYSKISKLYKKAISSHLDIEEAKISHVDHHSCHAAYALYGSPVRDDNTLVLTADAYGDGLSATVSIYDKSQNKIKRLKEYSHKDFRLARIYRYVTLLLRMQPNEHEYKVMGLAPYYNGPAIKDVEKILGDMQYLNGLDFKFNQNIKNIFEYLQDNLKHFRFDHIAAGIQSFTEKILVEWLESIMNEYDSNIIVFSGGISMNVKANMKISEIPKLKKFFVCGGGGDESIAMGACYHFAEINNIMPQPLQDLYLGSRSEYGEDDLALFKEYTISKFENESQIVEKILDNKIIATCLGRMEMGSRSLGNRSILADPRFSKNVEKINRMIKNRDFWMPFAPIILDEYQEELIINPKKIESPFMTIAFNTIDGKQKIPAATHQYDGTARPQILKKETNPVVWKVIKKFYDETKIPALLNTSFNLHGEPIVNTINDALHVFEKSELDVLWLDNHIIEKR